VCICDYTTAVIFLAFTSIHLYTVLDILLTTCLIFTSIGKEIPRSDTRTFLMYPINCTLTSGCSRCNEMRVACDAADGAVRHLYPVDITDMSANVAGAHSFGMHGENPFLDLRDIDLILPEDLRLKFSSTIPGHGYVHVLRLVCRLLPL
jgi:hypothetical protein